MCSVPVRFVPLVLTFVAALAAACAQEVSPSTALDASSADDATRADSVIIGAIDWQEASSLPEGSAERANSRAVAYVDIPALGQRCTGSLIAADVLLTNEHCIPNAAAAAGARAYFQYEEGGPTSDAGFDCSTFIGNDAGLDFALLRCAGNPGDTFGVVGLEATDPARNAGVYVIHQNCDYYAAPSCAPTKKYSPGRVVSTSGEIGHDADTLGGSSGSPLFSRATHAVVGLHHAGIGNDGNGRGSQNRAVPMTSIVPTLQARFPGLVLGARAPADAPTPVAATPDGYEPNDVFSGATGVQLPFSSVDARVETSDQDHFRFVAPGARTIRLVFDHAQGDLDLLAFDDSGQELGRSVGTTSVEEVALEATGPVVVRIFGYRGAVGGYALDVR